MSQATKKPKTDLTPEQIRDISVEVYKIRLEESCKGDVERMLKKDEEAAPGDKGKRLRNRAGSYDPLTRAYLRVIT
jgi:hypothetical protein